MFARFASVAAVSLVALTAVVPGAEARPGGARGQLSAGLTVPYQCSIDGGHHIELTAAAGQNNVRRAEANALQLSQNGATVWTLSELKQERLPIGSTLNWGSGIGVDFQNRAVAPMNLGENDQQRLTANVRDSGNRRIRVEGAFSAHAAVLANIDEDARTVNPHTNATVQAPLLANGEYRISTVLRCTAARR